MRSRERSRGSRERERKKRTRTASSSPLFFSHLRRIVRRFSTLSLFFSRAKRNSLSFEYGAVERKLRCGGKDRRGGRSVPHGVAMERRPPNAATPRFVVFVVLAGDDGIKPPGAFRDGALASATCCMRNGGRGTLGVFDEQSRRVQVDAKSALDGHEA